MEAALTYTRNTRAPVASGFTGIGVFTPPLGTLASYGSTGTAVLTTLPLGTLASSGSTGTAEVLSGSLFHFWFRFPERPLAGGSTGTMHVWRELFEAATRSVQQLYSELPDIIVESTDATQQIFDAIEAFYLSNNRPRDRQIADRLTSLYRDALAEDEHILPPSLSQFTQFFLNHPDLGFPRITLTPEGTLRARWIQGPGNFVAIEFTGEPNAKLVAEIPGLEPPIHFSTELLTNIVAMARAMGGSFA